MIPWWDVPAGIEIPGLGASIHIFGVLVAIGVTLGCVTTALRAKKYNLNLEILLEFVLFVLITAFTGSHIFSVIFYSPEEFFENPFTLLNPFGSQSSIGGFLSAFLGAYFWKLKRKMDVKFISDFLSFGMPVGWFFGRLGCFVVHDHPGKLTNFFLGVQNYKFPGLEVGTRHDLGLYEVIWCVITFVSFLTLDKKPRPAGFFTVIFFTFFAISRFFLDFIREVDPQYYGLTTAQWVCTGSTIVGFYYLRKISRNGEYGVPEALLVK